MRSCFGGERTETRIDTVVLRGPKRQHQERLEHEEKVQAGRVVTCGTVHERYVKKKVMMVIVFTKAVSVIDPRALSHAV